MSAARQTTGGQQAERRHIGGAALTRGNDCSSAAVTVRAARRSLASRMWCQSR
jgi:hypothetical protein